MARDYDRRRDSRKQKSNGLKQIVWVFISFVTGYLTAAVFDLNSLEHWLNSNILANANNKAKGPQAVVAKQEAPKPKFEFYTLLAKDPNKAATLPKTVAVVEQKPIAQVATPPQPLLTTNARAQAPTAVKPVTTAPVAVATAQPVAITKPVLPVASIAKESFLIQIASFKNRQDAEKLKASLILKGFDVNVSMATQQQVNWYRVIVCPFSSRNEAQKTQSILARNERINGMIRKVG